MPTSWATTLSTKRPKCGNGLGMHDRYSWTGMVGGGGGRGMTGYKTYGLGKMMYDRYTWTDMVIGDGGVRGMTG